MDDIITLSVNAAKADMIAQFEHLLTISQDPKWILEQLKKL